MQNFKPRALVCALTAIGAFGALSVSAAFAQATTEKKPEKIEVTGSNIKRVDAESASNVQILTKADIDRSGAATVSELLKTVPALGGGDLNDFNAGNGFARGTTSASLRGLGSVGTLVLINGRRVAPSATADINLGQGAAYNLNTIPLSAIERIEVLKEGASAIYGSDAIAGVINFILRKDYQGAEVRVLAGSTLKNAFRNGTVTATAGFGDLAKDRYNVLISGEYFTREPEDYNAPNGTQNDAYRALGTGRNVGNNSSLSAVPNFRRETVLGNGNFGVQLPTDPRCPAANVVAVNNGCRESTFNYAQIVSKQERYGFMTKGTLDLSANLQANAEVAFTRATGWFLAAPPTLDILAPAIWFSRDGVRRSFTPVLPAGHPDNPTTVPVGIRYRFSDFGPGVTKIVNDSSRVLLSLSGSHFGWDWESAFLGSKTRRLDDGNGRLFLPAVQSLFAGTSSYRIGASNNSQASKDALNPMRHGEGETKNTGFDIKGSREVFSLPGGMAAVAVGLETRRESFSIVSDPRTVSGDIIGLASTTVDGSRTVSSGYVELSAPILKNVETQLAFRTDRYSDFGNSTTPKFGIKWKALNTLSFRGTYSEAFRAPSLSQASNSRVQAFTSVVDPVRCPNGTNNLPAGAVVEDCARTIAVFFPAAGNLEPEKSKSWSYGFIFSPMDNLDLQADLFEIRRRNEIAFGSINGVIAAGSNQFGTSQRSTNTSLFLTNAAGAPIPGTGPLETAQIFLLNLAESRVKGVDVDVAYRFKLGNGNVRLNAVATWMLRYDWRSNPAGTFVNGAGNFWLFETPKLRGNATAVYTQGDWEGFWRMNYTGGWDYGDPTAANGCYLAPGGATLTFLGRCQVASLTTQDLGVTYRGFKNVTLGAVIRNIENRKAPYDPNQTTLGFNPSYHNPYGANAQLSATYRFK